MEWEEGMSMGRRVMYVYGGGGMGSIVTVVAFKGKRDRDTYVKN